MTVLKLTSFGGEVPRRSARHLPDGAAVFYENLLTTSEELRPLAKDVDVAAGITGAKTLYRLSRDANGDLRTDPASGWIATRSDLNYVKGQLNDDATERTVVADNTGVERPRVIDAQGADRLLGVPPPALLSVAGEMGEAFTGDEARDWLDNTLPTLLANALLASSTEKRYVSGSKPLAGTRKSVGDQNTSGVAGSRDWLVPYTQAKNLGLTAATVDQAKTGNNAGIRLKVAPRWREVSLSSLETRLRAINRPTDNTPLFDPDEVQSLARALADIYDPEHPDIAGRRTDLDNAASDLTRALTDLPDRPPENTKPKPPTKPTVPEYYYIDNFGDSDRRLKHDIVRVGDTHIPGVHLYEFRYNNEPSRRYLGVMSDEVRRAMPEAVRVREGYDQVNYAVLGLKMQRL